MKTLLKNFFVIEGLDGAGTTTQAKRLAVDVPDMRFEFEPTDGKIGKELREILSSQKNTDKMTLSYLFAADRSDHLNREDGILSLTKQQKVICDRYILSSFAYQTLDIPDELVILLNHVFPIPEITFFLDTDVSVCMERIKRRERRDIYEYQELQERIRENYLRGIEIYRKKGWRIEVIDGNRPPEVIFQSIVGFLI